MTYHNYAVSDLVISGLVFRVLENIGINRELDDDTCCFGARCEGKRDCVGIKSGADVCVNEVYPAPFDFEENLVGLGSWERNFVQLSSGRQSSVNIKRKNNTRTHSEDLWATMCRYLDSFDFGWVRGHGTKVARSSTSKVYGDGDTE